MIEHMQNLREAVLTEAGELHDREEPVEQEEAKLLMSKIVHLGFVALGDSDISSDPIIAGKVSRDVRRGVAAIASLNEQERIVPPFDDDYKQVLRGVYQTFDTPS